MRKIDWKRKAEKELGWSLPPLEQIALSSLPTLSGDVDPVFVEMIGRVGIQSPIILADMGSKLVIVNGKKRVKAARLLGHTHISGHIYRQTALYQGKLPKLEKAAQSGQGGWPEYVMCNMLAEDGWDHPHIATFMGLTVYQVERRLALNRLSASVIQEVESGKLPVDVASELADCSPQTRYLALQHYYETGEMHMTELAELNKVSQASLPTPLLLPNPGQVDPLFVLDSLDHATLLEMLADGVELNYPPSLLDAIQDVIVGEKECTCNGLESVACIVCRTQNVRVNGHNFPL